MAHVILSLKYGHSAVENNGFLIWDLAGFFIMKCGLLFTLSVQRTNVLVPVLDCSSVWICFKYLPKLVDSFCL